MNRIIAAIFIIIGTSSAALSLLAPPKSSPAKVESISTLDKNNLSNELVAQSLTAISDWLHLRKSELLAGSSIISGNLLRWSNFEVSGNYYLQPEELAQVVALAPRPWFWQISPTSIQKKLETLSWIKSSIVTWSFFPLTLKFRIEEHRPWLVAEYEGHNWVLSRALSLIVPLSSVKDPDLILELSELPRLSGLQPAANEATYLSSSNARLRHAAGMIQLLELGRQGKARTDSTESGIKIERYDLLSDGSLMLTALDSKLTPKIRIAPTSLEEAEQVSDRIVAVLRDLAERGERASEIDLRFANQAVVR